MLYGAQFLATSYLAKHFSLTEFSEYALVLSICSPIFLFFNMNIRVLTTTKGNEFSKSEFGLLRIVSLVFAFLLASSIAFLVLDGHIYSLFIVLALFRGFDGLFEWSYGFFLKSEASSNIGMSQIFRSFALAIPILIGLLIYEPTLFEFFMFTIIGLSVVFLCYDNRKQPLLSFQYTELKIVKNLALVGLPLGMVALFDSLCIQIPKYTLEYYKESELVGVFTSLFVFLQTMSYTGFALVNSTLPSLSTYIQNKNKQAVSNLVKKSSIIMFLMTIGFIIGVYFLGGWVLRLVYTPEIALHKDVFIIMSIFTLPMQLTAVYAYVLYGFGRFKTYLLISLITVISCAILSIYFVQQLSILGAVLAFGFAMTLKCIIVWMSYLRAKRELI